MISTVLHDDVSHRGELMERFCAAKDIRTRIEIKREALSYGYRELVDIMLKKLVPDDIPID